MEVFRADCSHPLHFLKIKHYALPHGYGISFEADSRTPGCNRDLPLEGIAGNPADPIGAVWPEHGIGKNRRVIGFAVGMKLKDRISRRDRQLADY
jgi:hypothetical protein